MKSIKSSLPICRTIAALRLEITRQKSLYSAAKVGMVPTMGALHAGHLSLIQKASSRNEIVILTIFVNPLQFGVDEDFDSYPKSFKRDVDLGLESGATLIFAPKESSFYSPEHQTTVTNFPLQNKYCGEFRPGHFDGVLTVVAKLLFAGMPDESFFGKKDYQQLYLIKKMVNDLNIPVRVFGLPTKRESSGLALSSRNEYLSVNQQGQAALIYKVLKQIKKGIKNGENWSLLRQKGIKLLKNNGFSDVQYLEYVSRDHLLPFPVEKPNQSSVNSTQGHRDKGVLIIAAILGETRLIDNLEV
jgi:pantoate--beta-alanine ligase